MSNTIFIEGIKVKILLQIPTRRWQDPIKPGIKSILRLRLAMRWPSDGLFANKNRASRLFERIVVSQEGLYYHD
jgi:hypothetical protein